MNETGKRPCRPLTWMVTVAGLAVLLSLLSAPIWPAALSKHEAGLYALIMIAAVVWHAEHTPEGYTLFGLNWPVTMRASFRQAAQELLWSTALTSAVLLLYGETMQATLGIENPCRKPLRMVSDPMFVITQLLVIAWPEELFFRGYLYAAIARSLPAPKYRSLFGANMHLTAWCLQAVLFATMHVVTEPDAYRLLVFFPGLFFGWMRVKRSGVGAATISHTLCNAFGAALIP